ncbi:MAG: hypothetical protein KDB53_11880, partial [Planctomycetes bacterium]|nr:hypothetical protein [Planctomycetota bacterium]
WVAAAPVPPTAESFEALLGSPADRAAFILGLTGERAALGTQLEVITDAAGDPTYRLLAPGMVARSLELVVPGKAAILLVPRGPDRWESRPGNPRYEPQTVSLRDESGMTLARLWLTPGYPVLDQGGRSPPAAALKGLLTAGPRSGAPGKLPRGMLLLALLLLLADLGLRLRFGR